MAFSTTMMPMSVSSPRRLRPKPFSVERSTSPGAAFNINPESSGLGVAGAEEIAHAHDNEAAAADASLEAPGSAASQAAHTAAATTSKIVRGLRSSIRRGPKGILKNTPRQLSRSPTLSPDEDLPDEARQDNAPSYHWQTRPSPAPQSPEPTLEGTTLLGHDPNSQYPQAIPPPTAFSSLPRHPPNSRVTIADVDDLPPTRALYAADYKKMPAELYVQPLLSLDRIKAFFLYIHNLPWIAPDRITVDYYPGRGTRISTGISDLGSAVGSSSAASSPSFSGARRRPTSSWFQGGHLPHHAPGGGSVAGGKSAVGSKRGSLDLVGSLDSVPVEEVKPPETPGATFTPLAGWNGAGPSGTSRAPSGTPRTPYAGGGGLLSPLTPRRPSIMPLSPSHAHNRLRSVDTPLLSPLTPARPTSPVIPPISPSRRTPRTPLARALRMGTSRNTTPGPVITNALPGDFGTDSPSSPPQQYPLAPAVNPDVVPPPPARTTPVIPHSVARRVPAASLPFRTPNATGPVRSTRTPVLAHPRPQQSPASSHYPQAQPIFPITRTDDSTPVIPVIPSVPDDDSSSSSVSTFHRDTDIASDFSSESSEEYYNGYGLYGEFEYGPGYPYGPATSGGDHAASNPWNGSAPESAYSHQPTAGAIRSRAGAQSYMNQQQQHQAPPPTPITQQQNPPSAQSHSASSQPQGPPTYIYVTTKGRNAVVPPLENFGSNPGARAGQNAPFDVDRIASAAGHAMFNSPVNGFSAGGYGTRGQDDGTIDGGLRGYAGGYVDR